MRGQVKINGEWKQLTLSEDHQLLFGWLKAHDGREAVCIDDAKQIYYCSTEALRDQYKKGGKKAKMFFDLAQGLKINGNDAAHCPATGAWCSERGECGGRLRCQG